MKGKLKNVILFILGVTVFLSTAAVTFDVFSVDLNNSGDSSKSDYSDSLKNTKANVNVNSKEYIGFYVENPMYLVNGTEKQIDAGNSKVVPYLKNGQVYIPVRLAAEALDGSIEWDAKKNTAAVKTKSGDVISLTANSDVINITTGKNKTSRIQMAAKAELREKRLYAPAASIAKALGKNFIYEQGLILIADDKYSPDKAVINKLIEDFTGITNVGTKEKFVELLGYDPTEEYPYLYGTDDMNGNFDVLFEAEANVVESIAAPSMSMDEPGAVPESPSSTLPAESKEADSLEYSETNTQVKGVDEADIIKTDGQYIYYVRNGGVEIIKANADGSFEYMSLYKLPDGNMPLDEIYVDGDYIIAIGSQYKYNATYTTAVVINTKNKNAPKLERSVEVKGDYVTSRKIGSSVYFTANQYLWHGSDEILPSYRDTAISGIANKSNKTDKSDKTDANMIEIGYDRLRCFPVINGNSMTSLVGFNIDRPDEEAFIETFLGCGNTIYMSGTSMYIVTESYDDEGYNTTINKFAADDGKLVFVKSGKAPGAVLNQFSMDEYQSHFRIATTVNNYNYRTGSSREYNGLYIFDSAMQLAGSIDDIAPGEHIYSVRFMGSRAFMVTFKTVDPLFAIDLSDPKNPIILGALKIPGYSNYLHPYDENHLIGFGKDTVVDSYNNAYYTSMKISLFDVTDMTNPVEMFVETIGARGTDSELLNNHKALLFSKEKNLLAFPVRVYESTKKAVDGVMPSYGTFSFAGAYIYDIDLKNGFTFRDKITHLSGQDMLKSSDWGANDDFYIQRLLTIRDTLYAASDGKITSHDLETMKFIDELDFDKIRP